MDRILRFGAPALAMVLAMGCGAQEDTTATPAPEPGASSGTAKDAAPSPAPTPSAEQSPSKDASPAPSKEGAPGLEGPKTSGVEFSPDEIANIKKLPADEAEVALKQGVCPVSDENLGMDVPVKVTAEGRTFYLCCKSCEEAVTKDPKKYIAKLDKK